MNWVLVRISKSLYQREIGYKGGCQITDDNVCTEIAYIWRKIGAMDSKRAELAANIYSIMFRRSREGQEIRPRGMPLPGSEPIPPEININ